MAIGEDKPAVWAIMWDLRLQWRQHWMNLNMLITVPCILSIIQNLKATSHIPFSPQPRV